jgi:hypothetical protein
MPVQGHGVAQNFTEAVKWWRHAADQGHEEAQHLIGRMYYLGQGLPANDHEGRRWHQKAADQGLIQARQIIEQFEK